jgi:Tfp pilus assembly pilus retraction ATPase PilT
VAFRINGDIVRRPESERVDAQSMQSILQELMNLDQKRYEEFYTQKDADFSYVSPSGVPYRVNAYFSTGKLSIAMRKINRTAKKLEELMFSDMAEAIKKQILQRKK